MNPTQVTNLQTNLKAVHRFYKYPSVWSIVVAMAGSPEAAQLLNIIIGKLSQNTGTDEYVQMRPEDGATGKLLGDLLPCGVRNLLINDMPYCCIDTMTFTERLAQVLKTGPGAARLLLQLPWHMDYKTYITSPQWGATRVKRFIMDNFTCKHCRAQSKHGARVELEVHHTSPEAYTRLGKENIATDLITLCIDCHRALHAEEHGERYYTKPRKRDGLKAVGE